MKKDVGGDESRNFKNQNKYRRSHKRRWNLITNMGAPSKKKHNLDKPKETKKKESKQSKLKGEKEVCLLYTSDAADE